MKSISKKDATRKPSENKNCEFIDLTHNNLLLLPTQTKQIQNFEISYKPKFLIKKPGKR